jgi:hypothetical protein
MNTPDPAQDYRTHPQDSRDSQPQLVLVRTAGGAVQVIDASDAEELVAQIQTPAIRRGVDWGVVLFLEHTDLEECA